MSVLKQVMDTQEKAFKSSIKILIEDVKSEVKDIRNETEELKLSVKFMSGKYDYVKEKIVKADNEINGVYVPRSKVSTKKWTMDLKIWSGNRNTLKTNPVAITLKSEEARRQCWENIGWYRDSCKKVIREKLGIEENVKIERVHHVGKKLKAAPCPAPPWWFCLSIMRKL